ncbi:MAG: hypothetical protein H0X64_08760 [Gemmatimonadaceae bacterium]|nr:hypothetical protein [Gemmatimonadaceae bacterium]
MSREQNPTQATDDQLSDDTMDAVSGGGGRKTYPAPITIEPIIEPIIDPIIILDPIILDPMPLPMEIESI